MRPTLSQCFPNPLARQWPSTSNPVSCECQQLYALVCLCCCIPKTHLLVLHEGEGNNMVNSMPKGPKYVDFKITQRTTSEDLGSFLYRAELASITSAAAASQQSQAPHIPQHRVMENDGPLSGSGLPFSPAENSSTGGGGGGIGSSTGSPISVTAGSMHNGNSGAGFATGSSAPANGNGGVSSSTGPVVVVCLHGVAVASPEVRSVLMDVLINALVPYNRGAKAVLSLRIVAFCDYRACLAVLQEPLRAAFALSTFISGLSMDSAVVLQYTDIRASNIVNKTYMLEVLNAPDGLSLVDTVLLSGDVARYLRHLILTVQASTMAELVPGPMIIQRMNYYVQLLKMAALLFMPSEGVFARRANPRSSAFKSASDYFAQIPRSNNMGAIRRAYSGTQHGVTAVASGGAGLPDTIDDIFLPHKDKNGRITTFSHVVVSPSDVVCLVPAFITHHLTLHRAVVDVGSRLVATREAMAAPGAPLISEVSASQEMIITDPLAGCRSAASLFFPDGTAGCPSPGLWDARMASLALTCPPVQPSSAGRARRVTDTGSSDLPGNDSAISTLAMPPTARHSVGAGGPLGSSVMRRSTVRPSPLQPPLGDTWHTTHGTGVMAGVHADETEFFLNDMLNYCELREVVRATLVCRTHPAPC